MSLIHFKLSKIASQIPSISKGSTNKDDNYKFRGIYDIYNGLSPLFKDAGVVLVPNVIENKETQVSTQKGRALRITIKVEWTFLAEDGSSITATTIGEGIDTSDKASNKAMTASLKYLLIYMFLIPTTPWEVDADAHSPTITPFVETQKPASLMSFIESLGLDRSVLTEAAEALGIPKDKTLDSEDRKLIYNWVKANKV